MFGIFNIVIDSDMVFPELRETEISKNVIEIRRCEVGHSKYERTFSIHEWKGADGRIFLISAKIENGYLLQFPDLAEFRIHDSGKKINYRVNDGVPLDSLRHLIIDQVIPRVLGQKGHLVLHAAACEISHGEAIAFLGESGMGKSTLVSSFHQNGSRLISDDCILLDIDDDSAKIIPNYFGVRLFEDSAQEIYQKGVANLSVAHYTSKKRFLISEGADTGTIEDNCARLSAVFVLSGSDKRFEHGEVQAKRIAGAGELMSLIEQVFLLDPTDMSVIEKQFRNIGRIMDLGVPVYKLEYPRRHAELDIVRNRIMKLMGV